MTKMCFSHERSESIFEPRLWPTRQVADQAILVTMSVASFTRWLWPHTPSDAQRESASIWLSGRGRVPEAPLCAMVKMQGAFVLMPIDEITTMRPDLSKFAAAEATRDAAAKAKAADEDYKPSTSGRGGAASAPGADGKQAGLKTIKVLNCGIAHRWMQFVLAYQLAIHCEPVVSPG